MRVSHKLKPSARCIFKFFNANVLAATAPLGASNGHDGDISLGTTLANTPPNQARLDFNYITSGIGKRSPVRFSI